MSQIFWMRLAAFGDVLLMLLLAVASALTWLVVWSNLGSVLDFLAKTEFTAGQLGSVNAGLLIVSAALTLVVFGVRLRVGTARESRSIAIYSISILAIVIATSVLYAVAWPLLLRHLGLAGALGLSQAVLATGMARHVIPDDGGGAVRVLLARLAAALCALTLAKSLILVAAPGVSLRFSLDGIASVISMAAGTW